MKSNPEQRFKSKAAQPEGSRLTENPFFILRATPRDDEKKILSRALDLKLLYNIDTQEAQNELLHPAGRLDAEIRYLPGVPGEQLEEIRRYMERNEADLPAPDFNPASRLACLNGAAALMESWPVTDVKSAEAACLCLAELCQETAAKDAFEEVNADRAAGKMEPVKESWEIIYRLNLQKSALLKGLCGRLQTLSQNEWYDLRHRLADHFCGREDAYYRSPYLDEIVTRHMAFAVKPEISWQQERMQALMDTYRETAETGDLDEKKQDTENDNPPEKPALNTFQKKSAKEMRDESNYLRQRKELIADLLSALEQWDTLTKPERMITRQKGFMESDADKLFSQLHKFFIELVTRYGDIPGYKALIRKLDDVFFDLSLTKKQMVKKNRALVCNEKVREGKEEDKEGSKETKNKAE